MTLRLGVEATADDLHECDAVVVACGAEELLPVVGDPGFVSTSSEALAAGPERLRGAAHLVVVDDGFGWWPSVSAVELGVAAGVQRITLVTPGVALAMGIPAESRTQLIPRLAGVRLDIRPLTSLAGVEDGAVALRPAGGGAAERVEADAVIVVGERRPRDWAPLVADLPGADRHRRRHRPSPRRACHRRGPSRRPRAPRWLQPRRSDGGDEPAVGAQRRADEVGGVVGDQEGDRRGDLLGRGEPAGGRARGDRPAAGVELAAQPAACRRGPARAR